MTLRLDDYQDHHGLLEKIRSINNVYYETAIANIAYLQRRKGEVAESYEVALRDAYSHLAKVFEYDDILDADNKIRIVRQLERYLGHLEALLYDTYLNIIKMKSDELLVKLREGDQPKFKIQLAEKVQKARTVDDSITIQQKIKDFEEIISFIEDVDNTHQF